MASDFKKSVLKFYDPNSGLIGGILFGALVSLLLCSYIWIYKASHADGVGHMAVKAIEKLDARDDNINRIMVRLGMDE
jgi:hypothetical protein